MAKQPSTALPLSLSHVAHGIKGFAPSHAIEAFERSFAVLNGSRHAIAVGNGTTALYIA